MLIFWKVVLFLIAAVPQLQPVKVAYGHRLAMFSTENRDATSVPLMPLYERVSSRRSRRPPAVFMMIVAEKWALSDLNQ